MAPPTNPSHRKIQSLRDASYVILMPRLLILCEYPMLLGGEQSMLATLPAVVAAGFDVRIAAPPFGPLARAVRECSVGHVPLLTHVRAGERLPLPQLRSEIRDVLRRQEPALVHANSLSIARFAGPVVADSGVPGVGHLRDIVKLSRQAVDDLNRHRVLVAVSTATREYHAQQRLDGAKCIVSFNGVDLDRFRPRPRSGYLHRELQLPDAARFVVTIGQLGLRKGTDVALAAASEVMREMADVHWLIVGERTSGKAESVEFEASLRAVADEPPLRGRVHFLGQRSDVCELLNECHVLVHAARQEPLGRVLLEAAASGLPVMVTDVGGTHEIFPTETDGALLVPADNAKEMARAVLSVMGDASLHRALSTGARQRAEEQFDVDDAARRLVGIYESVLK